MITENNITVVKLPKDPKDPSCQTTFEASLRVMARHTESGSGLYPSRGSITYDQIELKLKRMLMDEVYGDLREPLNKLFDYAHTRRHLSPNHRSNKDYAEIMDIRQKLRAFL